MEDRPKVVSGRRWEGSQTLQLEPDTGRRRPRDGARGLFKATQGRGKTQTPVSHPGEPPNPTNAPAWPPTPTQGHSLATGRALVQRSRVPRSVHSSGGWAGETLVTRELCNEDPQWVSGPHM